MLNNIVLKKQQRLSVSRGCFILLILIQAITASAQTSAHRSVLQAADSLFQAQQWKTAKEKYQQYVTDTVTNPVTWNRLGFCNYHLGLYRQSVSNYEKALTLNPAPPSKECDRDQACPVLCAIKKPKGIYSMVGESRAVGLQGYKRN